MLFRLTKNPASGTSSRLFILWSVTAFQLAFFAYSWLPHVDSTIYPLNPSTTLTDRVRKDSDTRIFVDRRLHRGEQYLFINNTNVAYGIAEISGFESLLPRSFYLHVPLLMTDSSAPSALLSALNVKYLVTGRSVHLPNRSFRLVDSGAAQVWETRTPHRRAWLAFHSFYLSSDSGTVHRLNNDGHDPREVIFTTDSHAPSLSQLPDTSSTVRLTKDNPEDITIEVSSKSSAYLVLSDLYYPGWEACVDGKPETLYRANYAMRAVLLPAGDQTVEFHFRPLSFRVGCWLSLSAAMASIVLLIRTRKLRIDRVMPSEDR